MGWRSKFIFLLIVYFAGFATAIYYLAPSDRGQCQAASFLSSLDSGSQGNASALCKGYYDKAYAKASESFSQVDWQDLKERFNRGLQKLMEMANKNSQNAAEGAEDK